MQLKIRHCDIIQRKYNIPIKKAIFCKITIDILKYHKLFYDLDFLAS